MYLEGVLKALIWFVVVYCCIGLLIVSCDIVEPTQVNFDSMFVDTVFIHAPKNLSNSCIIKCGYTLVSVLGIDMIDTIVVPQFSTLTAKYVTTNGNNVTRDTLTSNNMKWRVQ